MLIPPFPAAVWPSDIYIMSPADTCASLKRGAGNGNSNVPRLRYIHDPECSGG